MRRTIYDGKDLIVKRLIETVKPSISGGIFRDRRPSGSVKEDIVVNALPMTADFHQRGVFNVNVYVPFISVTISGIQQDQPNNSRLKALATIVQDSLHEYYGADYNFYVENVSDFEEQAEKANFINFRVRMNLFNNN